MSRPLISKDVAFHVHTHDTLLLTYVFSLNQPLSDVVHRLIKVPLLEVHTVTVTYWGFS